MASKKPSLAGEGLGLFTDFVQGVREGIKLAGGTDKQLESLRDKRVIATIVNLIMVPVQKVLQFLDRCFSVTMDLTKSMTELVASGHYAFVNPEIAMHFDFGPGDDVLRSTKICLLHYNKRMTSDQVLADMWRQGLRPATFLELLWVGIQHPSPQKLFPIIALGTVVRVGVDRKVASLDQSEGECLLGLSRFASEWHASFRFAAVDK